MSSTLGCSEIAISLLLFILTGVIRVYNYLSFPFLLYFPISDKVPPVFDFCPAEAIQLLTDLGESTSIYEWPNPMAHDNLDTPNITCNYASGTNFTIGQTSVDCVAMDSRGNKNTCQFAILVQGMLFFSLYAYDITSIVMWDP